MAEVKAIKEDFLHCSICTNRLKVPKVLPCIHSFCQGCLETYVKKLKSKQLPCPICRKVCDLSETGVKGLQTNFYIVNLGERMDLLERLGKSVSHSYTCESCGSQEVAAYCLECESKICLKCQQDHQRFPVLRSHSIIPINEIKQPKYQKALKNAKTPMCEVHPTESLRFYCKTCSKLICRDCTIVQHSKPDHTFVEASCQVEDIKRELRDLLSRSSSDHTSSLKFIEKGMAGSEEVERQSESIIKKINTSCDKMVVSIEMQLRSQAEEMCKEVRESMTSQTKMIDERVNMASTWVTRMENTREVTEKILDENNLWEILAMSHDLVSAFHALNIDAGDFKWYQSDLEQSIVFSSFQPPSVTLGRCSKAYDVILSDTQGNFIAVTFDCVSSELRVLKIPQDTYNVDDASDIASVGVNFTVPKNSKVTAAIARNENTIFIGLGRCIVQLMLSSNSQYDKIMEASKDEDTLISFLAVSDNNKVLYLQLSNDNHVKQFKFAQFDRQYGYSSNREGIDITSYLTNTQFIIQDDHLPIQNVVCHGNTLIYSLKEGSYPKNITYMLFQKESTTLVINSMDTVRGRQLLSIFQGVYKGSSQRLSGGRRITYDVFTCYMLWGKASSSPSRSASTFIITEYNSSSQKFIRTWNVPGEVAQPAACYKNPHSNQLVVSDQYGKVTTCL
ncbi:E3 ubiquitin-protein ligase TRIM56 [Holothuria leucospilota]|uniref:E3 ubiquitin-protein ligase TRIM56 n=1 Tax=Holothuria leucospilota TaxID=206669 RepID=A0A9Q1BUJ6_HOLLE|nr:E3 ubiquitin-protein ligase TRIM56 [Holothuria leucospilota]